MKLFPDHAASSGEKARFPWRLLLFGAAGVTAFAFGFLAHTPAQAGLLVQRFGYAAMLSTFVWWLFILAQLPKRPALPQVWRWMCHHRPAVILICAITAVASLTLPFSYKILYDELVLQATGWNIHCFREFGTITRGYEVEGVFRSLEVYVDKRPFFYPFLVSLLHDLTGYRETNGAMFNTMLLPVVLFLLYAVLKKLTAEKPALIGLVFFGASSLLAQNANGNGMELLNLAMLLFTLWLAMKYLEDPAELHLSALVLSTVLLAQTRYESTLFVVPAALAILEGWRRSGRVILPAAGLFAPLLLIPSALHNIYLSGTPALWELREDTSSRFSTSYLPGNLKHAAIYFFDFSGEQLNAWWFALLGIPAVLFVAVVVVRRARDWKQCRPESVAVILFCATALANFWVLMFYYWGQLDDPIVARLILPCNVVLAFAIGWVFSRQLVERQQKWTPRLVTVALLGYVAFGSRATAHNLARNELASEIAWEEQWVDSLPGKTRLIITNKSPLAWLVRQVSSISVPRARNVAEQVKFHLDQHTFQEVLVSQYYRPTGPEGNFQLDPRDELPAAYVLEPVLERRIGMRLLRISRVVDIKIEKKARAELAKGAVETAALRS